jgi:uncharacterized damage-inducible protein DinB
MKTQAESAVVNVLADRFLANRWQQVSQKIVALANEVPEDKFDWAPTPELRTCAGVLRHVAFWNQYVAACLLGKDFDDAANELRPERYAGKQNILKALTGSSQEVVEALTSKTSPDPGTTELIVTFVEHTSEHYGQLVVYARLLNIVPPSTRRT